MKYTGIRTDDADQLLIGGTGPGAGNLISGNTVGIEFDPPHFSGRSASVVGNLIGTDFTGTDALGNSSDGVEVLGGENITIGGVTQGTMSVDVCMAYSSNTQSAEETLYRAISSTDITGTQAANRFAGLAIGDNATSTLVGGTTPAARNISGNRRPWHLVPGRPPQPKIRTRGISWKATISAPT